MNITPETMYWITRCDNIHNVSVALAILSCVGIFFMTLHIIIDEAALFSKFLCLSLWAIFFVSISVFSFVPTTKEMAVIYVVPAIANSETVQGIGNDIVGLAKEWIVELKPKKNGEAK